MLTIRPEIRKREKRLDGTYNVKLRFTLNRQVVRRSTSYYVTDADVTSSFSLKEGMAVKLDVDSLVLYFLKRYMDLKLSEMQTCLEDIISILYAEKEVKAGIDFIAFAKSWIANTSIKGAKNYNSAINSFVDYLGRDSFPIQSIDKAVLNGYTQYLKQKHLEKAERLSKEGKRVPSERATSLYLGSLRHLYKEAQQHYNDYDRDIIRISNDPFLNYSVPRQNATRKRALSHEIIRKIYALPYKKTLTGKIHKRNVYNIAKDCFILSFCLMGMNSVDLFNANVLDGNTIIYKRTKTKARRLDEALMKVDVPIFVKYLLQRYRDENNNRLFNFYSLYNTEKNFNRAINKGLKEIGAELGIDDLEFYAARHSWATIALNKCKIDKYTVHSALNHVDPSMRVTDIYIERDFVNENEANMKVLKFVFG